MNGSFDEDRALDEWSFFTLIAEETEELRRRVQRKLSTMDHRRRADLEERVGPLLRRIDFDLRQAHNAANRAAGGRPRAVRASSRT